MAALVGGQISYSVETVAATVGHIKAGRLKAFGVTSARRTAALPELAPLAEVAALPGYDCVAWGGYVAPRGTPREIIERIAVEIQKAVQAADLKERFVTLGMDTASSSPEQMAAFMRREQERYATIIRKAGIK